MTKTKRSTILIVFASLCLAACTRTPSESNAPSGTTANETASNDTALKDSIKVRLFDNAALRSEPVEITTSKGEVTLDGVVSSEDVRRQIVDLVQTSPGVTKVHDALNVNPAAGAAAKAPAANAPTAAANSPAAPANASAAPKGAATPAAAVPPPPPPQPKKVVVKEGTPVQLVTVDPIDSDKAKIGSTYLATLSAPITVGESVIVPKNANAYLTLLDASNSGNFKGKSEIHVALDSIEFQGQRYLVKSSTYSEAGKSQGKETAKKVGIGAAVGGAIGAIAGGGKGAAIGAGIGAGGGAVTQVLTKGKQVQIPSETRLDFQLEKPLEITIQPSTKAPAK